MNTKTKTGVKIRDICFISMFAALIAACAQINIPTPGGVAFTLQTFAVSLAGIVLGYKKGVLSVVIYIILGIIGIPVFSGFSGGIAIITGKTGGFILSFPAMAFLTGVFTNIGTNKKNAVKYFFIAVGLITGTVLNYICGVLMFSAVTLSSLQNAFIWCVLPFIITDTVKIILAGITGITVKKIFGKKL